MARDSVANTIDEVIHEYRKRGKQPGWLLLGWESWYILNLQMSRPVDEPVRVTEFMGITVVVDEEEPYTVKVLPRIEDL